MNKVIFDGIWSHRTEWKHSSLDSLYDGTIILRTAHQDNFIYIFVDVLSDTILDKGADRTTICFDTNNDKSTIPKDDDYCFVAILGREKGFVMQGDSSLGPNSNFNRISSPADFIAIGNVSNENDRYSNIPHASYEFRIPTDLVGRSNAYGLFLVVYEANSNKFLTWPQNVEINNQFKIASPKNWGEMISIDNSLPEFPIPILILVPSIIAVIYFARRKYIQNI